MSFEAAGITDVGMPHICPEREDGIAVGRGVVVGEHDAHLMQVTENWFSWNRGVLYPYDRFAPIPNLIFDGKSHYILASNDI